MTRVRKNRSPFDLVRQRHRGGALEGRKNSSSKNSFDNKVSVNINKGATATDKVKTKEKETLFDMSFPHVIPTNKLENVHLLIRELFSARDVPKLPLAGRLKHFIETWKILTKDSEILELVVEDKIPFNKNPVQQKITETPHMNLDQRHQVQVEIDMLEKGAMCQTSHLKEEFLSNVFLVGKKGGGNRPVINLKHLNQFIPYQHFKMECLFCLREVLQKDDFMCKLDMKDAYFSVPLHQSSRKCQIFMVREPLRVPLSMFLLKPSTWKIYDTFKSPYISNEAYKYSSDNIPRRYAFNGTNNGGNFNVQRYNHLPSATSGFHFKHEEINFESSSRDRISWSDSKLCENDTFIARTKNKTDSGLMSRPACERFCHGLGADKTYRSFSFNNPSCITGTKLSISSAATDKCFKTQWVISRGPVLEQGVK